MYKYIESLSVKERAKVFEFIAQLQEKGNKMPNPYAEKLTGEKDIWELRIKWRTNAYRVFYFFFEQKDIYLVNAFLKKTNKTPRAEIKKAKKRIKEIKERKKERFYDETKEWL